MPFSIDAELQTLSLEEGGQEEVFFIRGALDTLKHFFLANGYTAEVRDDSRLAFLWASGVLPANIYDIAQEMATIQYISNNTDYHALTESGLRRIAESVKAKHKKLSWKRVWEIVREHGPDVIKYSVLHDHFLNAAAAGGGGGGGGYSLPEMGNAAVASS